MAYNLKIIDFGNEVQIRTYKRPVSDKIDKIQYQKDLDEEMNYFEKMDKMEITPFGTVGYWVDDLGLDNRSERQKYDDMQRIITVSTNRTKNKVYTYSRANKWDWFVTLTLSKEKIDRYDFDICSKTVRQWVSNIRKKYSPDLKYIIVPEQHKDGAWHFHGLFANIGDLKLVDSGKTVEKSGDKIYNFGNYKLGWSTATKIKDTNKAANYIVKYITKSLVGSTKSKQRYWVSQNLDLPTVENYYLEDNEKNSFLATYLTSVGKEITHTSSVCVNDGSFEQTVCYFEIQ